MDIYIYLEFIPPETTGYRMDMFCLNNWAVKPRVPLPMAEAEPTK